MSSALQWSLVAWLLSQLCGNHNATAPVNLDPDISVFLGDRYFSNKLTHLVRLTAKVRSIRVILECSTGQIAPKLN